MADKKNSGPERALGTGALGDINDPERVLTVQEQLAEEAKAAGASAKEAAALAKEEKTDA